MSRINRMLLSFGLALFVLMGLIFSSITQIPSSAEFLKTSPSSWPPFVRMIPQAGSDDVLVSVPSNANIYTQLQAEFGSTSHTWSHTDMDFDPNIHAYQGLAEDALSELCPDPAGCLHVYDRGLRAQAATGRVTIPYQFVRVSPQNRPDLALHSARLRFGSMPFGDGIEHTVILQIPPVPPAPLPAIWLPISSEVYLVESDGMDGDLQASLTIQYDPDAIVWLGVDESLLTLLAWDPVSKTWGVQESYVNQRANHVSASIRRLTAYVLVAPRPHVVWMPVILR